MKSVFFTLAFLLTVCANANQLFDANSDCNTSSIINLPDVPKNSCRMLVSRTAPGFNFADSANALSLFFFDSNYSISLNKNSELIPIRFVVFEDETNYNAVQAFVQTAYATRAPLLINFSNPSTNLLDEISFINSRKSGNIEKRCYKVLNSNGKTALIHCPIQSIQLGSN